MYGFVCFLHFDVDKLDQYEEYRAMLSKALKHPRSTPRHLGMDYRESIFAMFVLCLLLLSLFIFVYTQSSLFLPVQAEGSQEG